jgi:hypothetical protein
VDRNLEYLQIKNETIFTDEAWLAKALTVNTTLRDVTCLADRDRASSEQVQMY